VRESGNRRAISIFSSRAGCRTIILASGQYRPGDSCELVGHGNDDCIPWGSRFELIKPIAECVIFAFRACDDGSTPVDEKPPKIRIATLANAEKS
jgi:hypothetical protein